MTTPPFQIAVSVLSLGEEAELQELAGDRAVIRVVDVSTPDHVREVTADAHAVVVALQRMSAGHIAAFGPALSVIGRGGVGLDTIDLEAARAAGVSVVHEPAYATDEVADQAAALILACTRAVVAADRTIRTEGWITNTGVGRVLDLRASTLGVVGTGRIGRALVDRMLSFFGEFVVFDPEQQEAPVGTRHAGDLESLLRVSDVVSIHTPLTPETRGLIGAAELALLPPGAVVVNVSRGGIVDESALGDALRSGQLSSAGLDVFEVEPLPADSPLRGLDNLVLTPHIAGYSEGAGPRLTEWMLEDVLRHLEGRELAHGRYAVDARGPS
jgi:phosphoglycerate dehydrogenase-like enzyme